MNMSGWKFTTTSSNKLKTEIKYLSELAVNDPKNSLRTISCDLDAGLQTSEIEHMGKF